MQGQVVLLTIAYAALGALLLVILKSLPIERYMKATAIGAMIAFNIGVFFWSQGLLGWSAATAVPDRFKLLWARVVEPNPQRGSAGAIHLWVEALDAHNIPSGEPRAFVVPYSASLAAKAAAAQTEIKKGNAQGGRALTFAPNVGAQGVDGVNIRAITQGATPGGDPSGGGLFDPAALGGQSKSIDLVALPKPLLPPKDDP